MNRPTKWGVFGALLAVLLMTTLVYAENPWDWARNNGCSIDGCNGCGSYNTVGQYQCSPKTRFCTYTCSDGKHAACMPDDGC
jgi:hypothetical protein